MENAEKLYIRGGHPLRGKVEISGAKNSAVALIPATILANSATVLDNLPAIRDVVMYKELLEELGCNVFLKGDQMTIHPENISPVPMPNGKIKSLRASYYLMGALLSRFGEAVIGLPGGCNLGPRPIDQHIKGFEALGARVENKYGAVYIKAEELVGAKIYLDVVSVGATINIMLAAVRAKGQTIIENAAKEPEIVDVATLLNAMGAQIKGAGTDMIKITGVSELHGCTHSIIPDRIEAGTYMIAAAATHGDVLVDNVIPKHLEPVTAKLKEMGVQVEEEDDALYISGGQQYKSVDLKTLPYPGFPTDLQQPFTTLLTKANGTSIVTDNIYQSRFKHVDELRRMGANIKVEGRSAVIDGRFPLHGTKVKASDLRAGAALVIAGLMTDGVTEISGVEHIDRGYEKLEEKLKALGAKTWRASTESHKYPSHHHPYERE
ncbi:UDP-N-acetylglucosamine 1-carboxyvinyltransferase [Microaerobacter geothermalis]|uniref:UDP-N-acetylglucosamine 1-carboxyvinyltransferase n=1 Tax=Microaerobacter geothermalis TaxID=674972 RepID=UPI001F340DC7|nr:UDP-N-acetylglucosamine 1-carboxyvinyltransferase [Microaerobacter geothermalis]MCF6094067.1 UDP-N-acetylglucosamine 1-carboxyvinyltransferase [Microaerobacter geothermalis]